MQDCNWICLIGFMEIGADASACTECRALPAGAYWAPRTNANFTPCAAACYQGLYGQPQAGGGPCLRCSLFMQSAAAAGLYPPPPAVGGIWNDTDGRCNADSWACAPGFRRSPAGARYCCPLAIPHSSSLSGEGGGPCGVGCDAGFWWNSAAANCSQCDGSLLPANAAWLSTEAANGKVLA